MTTRPSTPDILHSDPGSAAQLRREAEKARKLADAAFGEDERRRFLDVAAMLDREARMIERALAEPETTVSR